MHTASIFTFGSGEVVKREQFVSGKTTDHSEAIQTYLTNPIYNLMSTA